MLIVACDVCRKQLANQNGQGPHFCERCMPFAQDFISRRNDAVNDATTKYVHSLEKFRNDYLQQNVLAQSKLKVVSNES